MTSKTKINQFRWLAATLMLVAAMVMPSVAWAEGSITPSKPTSGDGSAGTPYQIGTVAELYWFARLVNGDASVCDHDESNNPTGTKQNTAACAVLTANITVNSSLINNLNADGTVKNGYDVTNWKPIGGYYNSKLVDYSGTFDGNGKTISGLYYYYNETIDSSKETIRVYAGLFGSNTGTIKNVVVKDSYIKIDCNGIKTCYVGGLCGFSNKGTIENCDNASTVSVTETIKPTGAFVGGVCGDNVGGKIINCNNAGKVSSTVSLTSGDHCVGGVSGANILISIIENSSNIGTVSGVVNVGGVCGLNSSHDPNEKVTIKNCYNEGKVTGTNAVGGVCGNNGNISYSNVSVIENCYNTGEVTGTGLGVGGVSGDNKGVESGAPSTITNCYNMGVVKGTSYVGGVIGDIYGSGVVNVTNCYYLEGCNAEGTTFTRTEGTSKTEGQFKRGEVCYLLNGEKSEGTAESSLAWYQNIDTGTLDAYPLLDSNGHGTVFASAPCPSSFSNTKDLAKVEHNYVANSEYTKHNCEKCGETHDAAFTENDEANTISACHGFGSVTLKAPTKNLTYDGKAKEAAVEGALTGIATPNILYKLTNSSETATETAPINAGTYIASITYTIGGVDYSVSVEYTIEQADYVPNRPNELYGCIGEKLSTVSLKAYESWSWDNPGFALPKNVENITVKASYDGADKGNYKNITAVDVTIILIPYHNYTNGFCEYCGGYMPARIVSNDHHPELFGTHNGYYAIENAGQLYWFAGLVNGTLRGENQNISANAVLTGNITVNTGDIAGCNGVKGNSWIDWTPIGIHDESTGYGYLGTFDGNNKTISGLYFNVSNTNNVGLFGFSNGTIKNVGVVDSYFNGSWNVGGVCGYNVNGRIENCYTTSSVNGTTYIGGVCGRNDTRSKILNSYNLGAVSGTTNVGGVRGDTKGTITNCYYLANEDDKNGGKTKAQFKNGEVAYLLAQGCKVGETFYDGSVWGQQLGTEDYPVLGSAYKVLMAARDGLEGSIYWATFSNLNSNAQLIDPKGDITVYNATVSSGALTLAKRMDNKVSSGEGVLLKATSEYVNAKNISDYLDATTGENDLLATPKDAGVLKDTNYKHYRLTYNDVEKKEGIGFYLGVVKDATGKVTSNDGSQIRVTPGKAYLKVSTQAATEPSTAKLARGFAFPGDGETTGIECITVTDESLHRNGNAEGIFDLQGRKVSKPTKGVYINNGKKVIIK